MNIPSACRGPSFAAHAFICWAGEWSCEGAERVISSVASAGLDFVEIPPGDPDALVTDGLAFLRAKGAEHELFEQPPG